VALVREPRLQRHIAQGRSVAHEQVNRVLHPATNNILMNRQPDSLLKQYLEVRGAHARDIRKRSEGEIVRQMIMDKVCHLLQTSVRQTVRDSAGKGASITTQDMRG